MSKPVIGVVGLGIMGSAMAAELIKCGYPVVGYDVSAPACKRLKVGGGKAAFKRVESVLKCSPTTCRMWGRMATAPR
jgi:3-hydroxyisobutyrate dehydrogenase-like beta-hydroxyacid dehydrogenase